jgi:hypothetical protein
MYMFTAYHQNAEQYSNMNITNKSLKIFVKFKYQGMIVSY